MPYLGHHWSFEAFRRTVQNMWALVRRIRQSTFGPDDSIQALVYDGHIAIA